MFVLARLREDLYLLAQDDIADVIFTYLANLNKDHHNLQFTAGCSFLLELLYQRFEEGLLPPIFGAVLKETHTL